MTDTLFPADAVSGAPSYTGQMAAQTLSALVGARSASRPFGGRSGVAAGTPTVVSVSGTTITIVAHSGFLDLEASTTSGTRLYSVESQTKTLTAADATNQRVDSIFIRHDDPSQGDGSATPTPTVVYTAGTAGTAGGARGAAGGPPNIPARSFELAQITVPQSGGGSPTVSMKGLYVAATGGVVPTRSSTEYPSSPYEGQYVDDAALDALVRYSGSAWVPLKYGAWTAYTPSWSGASGSPSVGNGSLSGRYTQVGKLVVAQWTLSLGSTSNSGAGSWTFGLPLPSSSSQAGNAVGRLFATNSGVYFTHGVLLLGSNSSSVAPYLPSGTAASNLVQMGFGTPWNFKNGDSFNFVIEYETA